MHIKNSKPNGTQRGSNAWYLAIAAITFSTAVSALASVIFEIGRPYRIGVVSCAAAVQIAAAVYVVWKRFRVRPLDPFESARSADSIFDAETEDRLQVLEEAGRFFGGSVSPDDVFPLLSDRICEIVPFDVLTVFGKEGGDLVQLFSAGRAAGPSDAGVRETALDLAKRSVQTGIVTVFPKDSVLSSNDKHPVSLATLPLARDADVFAVLSFCSFRADAFGNREKILLEAIGERVSRLITGAIAYGKQLSNSLSDPITGLANDRAFRLVLEGRVAEAERYKGERPLAVIAMDVRGFSGLNSSHGHSTGDKALAFTGSVIQAELRKMDLVARTRDDEFLAVLPSAGQETVTAIISRVLGVLSSKRFPLPDDSEFTIELHTGFASFARDGRSADELIKAARLRRDRSKINKSNQVILFPTQYSN